MKKKPITPREELVLLRERMENLETKLSLINEPLLVDALAYELLGVQSRMRFLIAREKEEYAMK
ncbi:MAG: hypothetical protein IJ407_02940 [Clostridia bacterium]|nr:hypothetical protein [Clostridia bacterium]